MYFGSKNVVFVEYHNMAVPYVIRILAEPPIYDTSVTIKRRWINLKIAGINNRSTAWVYSTFADNTQFNIRDSTSISVECPLDDCMA